MCGIVGYAGAREATDVVVEGLARLEYRGYDSAGVAVVSAGRLRVARRAGRLANLTAALDAEALGPGQTGIGHTRWATHGAPTDANAHPHTDAAGRLAVVHNGIIENYAELRAKLAGRGVAVASDTDTEVIAHLVAEELERGGSVPAAVRRTCRRLRGAYAFVAIHQDFPGLVVGARRNSPLVVGRGDGEHFVASDVSAFLAHTRDAVEIGDGQVLELRPDRLTVTDLDGAPAAIRRYRVDWEPGAAEKGGHNFFMLKEIAEQPRAVANTLLGRVQGDRLALTDVGLGDGLWRRVDRVVIVGCGSAFHAGLVTRHAVERWTRLRCDIELASELRYRDSRVDSRTLVLAISQSGETMDTLMAARHARAQGATVLAVCNTVGATIPREADAVLFTRAGPEIAVASTKAFLTQLVAGYLVALDAARARGELRADEIRALLRELAAMPDKVEKVLGVLDPVRELARSLVNEPTVLFLGRHVGHPIALEGALKLKEVAYTHAEGFAAGELKHGPIALIEEGTPVVALVPPREQPALHDKMIGNIQEVAARGALTIGIADEGDDSVVPHCDHVLFVPSAPSLLRPLVSAVPLQTFACEMAAAKGYDVDRPRNLAKSVTVE